MKNIFQKTNLIKIGVITAAVISLLGGSVAFAAIAQRGTATTATGTTTSLTISKPTGVVTGDILIVNIAQEGNNTTNPTATGWTLVAGADLAGNTLRRGTVLYRVANGTEGASFTFTLGSGATSAVGDIVAFSGVDTSGATPFDVAPGTISVQASQTAVAATTITTASANAAVIMFGEAVGSAPTWSGWVTTSPGTLAELYDNQSTGASVGAAWAIKTTAGTTGAGAATLSSAQRNGGILIALKPFVPPSINIVPTSSALTATQGISYSQTFTASTTATGPFTWSETGALPSGVTFTTSTATISGTPTVSGTFSNISISVNNGAGGSSATSTYTLTVSAAPSVTITSPTSLATGTIGTAYATTTIIASTTAGGTFNWSVSGLPTGLSLNTSTHGASTTISGTPGASGNFNVNVSVVNASNTFSSSTKSYSLTINSAPAAALTIVPSSLPGGTVGGTYSQLLTASTTATGTFTWTIASGALPGGLSLTTTSQNSTMDRFSSMEQLIQSPQTLIVVPDPSGKPS